MMGREMASIMGEEQRGRGGGSDPRCFCAA